MSKPRIPLAAPDFGDSEIDAVAEVLRSGWVTQGPQVQRFEKAFAAHHALGHAVACTSGTAALHLALMALGIGPGDEVVVPSFTWIASANVVRFCGATPVLADIDPQTFNMTADTLKPRLTDKTRAVICVHMFGLPADVASIRRVLPAGVHLVEDAACAAGARTPEGFVGGLGDIAAFSFHPRKSITTGEGGMVTTNSGAHADAVRMLRNHGAAAQSDGLSAPWDMGTFPVFGLNYRMSDILAAVGSVQLDRLDSFIDRRAALSAGYTARLGGLQWLCLPEAPAGVRHAWQSYVVSVTADAPAGRNDIMTMLAEAGISTRPGTHAVHMQACYRDAYGYRTDDLPHARDAAAQSLALPLFNALREDELDYICDVLLNI